LLAGSAWITDGVYSSLLVMCQPRGHIRVLYIYLVVIVSKLCGCHCCCLLYKETCLLTLVQFWLLSVIQLVVEPSISACRN